MTTKITFTLPAEALEGASEAMLLGDFNNWNPEQAPRLERQADGSFKTVAQLEEGQTYHYRFLLNDGRWVNDYHAQQYVVIPELYIDNCVVTVPMSEAQESETAESPKADTISEKSIKAEASTNAEPAKTAGTKKAVTKTKAPGSDIVPAKKVKAADKKADNKNADKPEKAAKKAAPKSKK